MWRPDQLTKKKLAEIVALIRNCMYMEEVWDDSEDAKSLPPEVVAEQDGSMIEYLDPEKDVGGSDLVEDVGGILQRAGLTPEKVLPLSAAYPPKKKAKKKT